MDHLPLTCSAPFEEFPVTAGMEALFPELGLPPARPVEVLVTVADGDRRRTLMDVVVPEAEAAEAFGAAFGYCEGMEDFEVTARRFTG
jgi:hypothetical protein